MGSQWHTVKTQHGTCMVQDSKTTTWVGIMCCRIGTQRKGAVGDNRMNSPLSFGWEKSEYQESGVEAGPGHGEHMKWRCIQIRHSCCGCETQLAWQLGHVKAKMFTVFFVCLFWNDSSLFFSHMHVIISWQIASLFQRKWRVTSRKFVKWLEFLMWFCLHTSICQDIGSVFIQGTVTSSRG